MHDRNYRVITPIAPFVSFVIRQFMIDFALKLEEMQLEG
jgi:hypothetical protein